MNRSPPATRKAAARRARALRRWEPGGKDKAAEAKAWRGRLRAERFRRVLAGVGQ